MATETAGTAERATGPSGRLQPEDRVALLRHMLLMRAIEERAMNLYRQGKVPGSFYDGFGQEAVSVGAAFAMAAQDRLCILHRDLGAHLVRGVEPARIFAQYMGRADGITRGRDGNVHFGDHTKGCVGMVSMLPDMMLVATGMAMAFRMRDEARCAITWFGDGSTSRGDFHEAMNWAGGAAAAGHLRPREQPVRVLHAALAAVRSSTRSSAPRRTGSRACAWTATTSRPCSTRRWEARERAISGGGPTLLEAVTMRMHGHAAHDDMKYVPKEQVEEWRRKDPIDRQSARVAELGVDVERAARGGPRAGRRRRRGGAALADARSRDAPPRACSTSGEDILLGDGDAPFSGFRSA